MEMRLSDDYTLLKDCYSGNIEAYGKIVQKYHSYVCALTYSALGDLEKSEELTQEVFIIVWNNLIKLKDYTKFKSWLYRITKNHIDTFFGKQRRDVLLSAKQITESSCTSTVQDSPESYTISKERQRMVWQILSEIPTDHRDILILYYWNGKSVKEVAHFYDLTEAAAKKRISRARDMVRKNIESDFEKTVVMGIPKDKFSLSVMALIAAGTTISSGQASAAAASATTVSSKSTFLLWLNALTVKTIIAVSVVGITLLSTVTYISISHQNQMPPVPENAMQMLPATLDRDLVLYLSFDKISNNGNGNIELVDQSGKSNNGLLLGGEFIDGVVGKALSLNKNNENEGVLVPDDPTLDLDAVTIAVWLKSSQVDKEWNRILYKDWRTAYGMFLGGYINNQKHLVTLASFECAMQVAPTKTEITDNKWHLIVGTYDGQTMCLYVDGKREQVNKAKNRIPMKHNDMDIRIGMKPDEQTAEDNHGCYRGLIDELRIYSRTLNPQEVEQLYRYRPDSFGNIAK